MAEHWLPILVFVVAAQGLLVVALTYGVDSLKATTWSRFDSALYLQVADRGYELFHCTPSPELPAGGECGNAGWFPLFPYAMAAVRIATPLSTVTAGVVLSWAFSLATLILLWRTFLGRRTDLTAAVVLAFALFGPGEIYRFTVYPMGMLAFFAVLAFWWASQHRWIAAGLAGAAVGASYHLGALIVVVLAVYAFAVTAADRRQRLRNGATAGGIALLGPLAVLVIMRIQTGAWDAFFQVQHKYQRIGRDPFSGFWNDVKPFFDGHHLGSGDALPLQTLLTTALILAVTIEVALRAYRRQAVAPDALLLTWGVLIWAIPLSQANVAVYRNYALMAPIAPLVGRLPRGVAIFLVGAFAWITFPIAGLFFLGKLL